MVYQTEPLLTLLLINARMAECERNTQWERLSQTVNAAYNETYCQMRTCGICSILFNLALRFAPWNFISSNHKIASVQSNDNYS
jgi:hypothetical protein